MHGLLAAVPALYLGDYVMALYLVADGAALIGYVHVAAVHQHRRHNHGLSVVVGYDGCDVKLLLSLHLQGIQYDVKAYVKIGACAVHRNIVHPHTALDTCSHGQPGNKGR